MPCQPVDMGKLGTAIVCTRGRQSKPKPCQEPGCTKPHTHLCDFPVVRKRNVGTCDRRICEGHASRIEADGDDTVDYCPAHAQLERKRAAMSNNSPADVGGSSEAGGWSGGQTRPGMTGAQRCSACRAEIRWLRTEHDRSMPVDAKPQQRVVLQRPEGQRGLFEAEKGPALVGVLVECWVPHWETCTDPDRFRGSRK